jgi:transposase InsO family protein
MEFRPERFRRAIAVHGVRISRIRPGRPQSNGAVESLHRTLLEECWRPAFARFIHLRFEGLRRELAEYLRFYNFDRAHTGRLTRGRIPGEIVYGARKMEPR